MRGIHYLTDEEGTRTAVVIDLETYGEEVEDFLDSLVAERRRGEPKEEASVVFERILKAHNG